MISGIVRPSGGTATTNIVIEFPGEELNRRLEQLSLMIERVSLLIEDAMVDPAETIALDQGRYNDLVLCISRYEELLNGFREITEDTTADLRGIVGEIKCCFEETDSDDDHEIEISEDDERRRP